MKILTIILMSVIFVGCSTLTGPASNNQVLAHTMIQYATIKAVEKSKDPKALATKARLVLSDIGKVLSDPNLGAIDLSQLSTKATAAIAKDIPDVADRLLANTLLQLAITDLQTRLGVPGVQILTPDQIAAIKVIGKDIEMGLTLGGY